MYQLTFTLQQHTPIIHFQYDQEDATLRATEVKPKLDRFIIEEKGGLQACRSQHNSWFNSDNHDSLDYKMKIESIKQGTAYLKDKLHPNGIINPVYFGNMGDGEASKHYSISEEVNITITSFCKELIDFLEEKLICSFFIFHNFSTRQTKGLGSFYPKLYQGKPVKLQPHHLIPKNSYWLEIESTDNDIIFKTIDFFWKWMKSGINYHGLYKDAIFKLFVSDKSSFKWEKRKVKEFYLSLPSDDNDKYFARAFMGMQDNFTYKWIPKSKRKPDEVYMPVDLVIKIKSIDKDIERNASPFIFIPVKQGSKTFIYILYKPMFLDGLFSKTFELSAAELDPVKLITGFDGRNDKIKKIFANTTLDETNQTINKAEEYLSTIKDWNKGKKAKEMIEKAKDFVAFTQSEAFGLIYKKRIIQTPSTLPDLATFLSFAKPIVRDWFDVRDFNNNKIITAKFLSNVN